MENTQFIFSSGQVELKKEGDNFFVEGYISTSDLDLVNDVVTKACIMDMADQMKERTIKLDVEHESFRGKSNVELEINKTLIPAAKIDDFLVDKKGLRVRAMLNKHSQRFDEVKGSIQDGFLDAFSIAYVPTQTKSEMRNGQEIRLLDKLNLLNVAFTGNPVNTHSSMTNVFAKSLEFLKDKENNHQSDTNNQKEVKKMSEEDKETKEESSETGEKEETEKTEEKKEEPKEETKDESEEEKPEETKEPEKAEPEQKSELQKLKEEMVEVKAALKRPLMKSKVAQKDKSENFVEEKNLNPLDVIA